MSSQDQEDLFNVTDVEEEGKDTKTDILDSSIHEDGEQDLGVDESIPEKESTPKDTSAAEAADEQMDSTPVDATAATAVDTSAAEAVEENPSIHEMTGVVRIMMSATTAKKNNNEFSELIIMS
jgi:hypothetical protein